MEDKLATSDKEYFDLLNAVNKPKPQEEDKKRFRQHLAENPKVWQEISDLSKKVENNILLNHFETSFLIRESYRNKLAAMRDNLGWNNASEIEKILIEQVCLNWLRLNLLESVHSTKTRESHSTETGLYWDKRLNSAQRRYLRACESLAKVRKLLADAELKEQQAQIKRKQSTVLANKRLKELT